LGPRRAAAHAAAGSGATVSPSPTPTNPLPTPVPWRERVRTAVSGWFSAGASAGRTDALTIVRAAVAAARAYFVSGLIWGHEHPFFSAIVAFVIIGFGIEKKMRKIVEMSAGVMLGVVLGELARSVIGSGTWQIVVVVFVAGMAGRFIDSSNPFGFPGGIQSLPVCVMPIPPLIGSGTWQIVVVVFVAGMAARFIDSSNLFGFQTAIQSLLVMIMPMTPIMTPGGRVLDALTGVTVAIIIHLLLSGDPRRIQRRAA